MCKDNGSFYRLAVGAALAALTTTLGWVLLHIATSAPIVI
jgi:hypothetical protein